MEIDWGAPAAWRLRATGFGALRPQGEVVAIEYWAQGSGWSKLRDRWLGLRAQRSLLEALCVDGEGLLVRYAALNWKHPHLSVEAKRTTQTAAIWIIDLADAYRALADEVADDVGFFWNPLVNIDLDERPRLAFLATRPRQDLLPPELRSARPKWDERTLVYQVGRALKQVARFAMDVEAQRVVLRCLEERPSKRWKSLDRLVQAAEQLGVVASIVRAYEGRTSFRQFEQGLGWLQIGDHERALEHFKIAGEHPKYRDMAEWGCAVARKRQEPPVRQDESESSIVVDDPALATSRTASGTIGVKDLEARAAVPALLAQAAGALRQGDPGYAASLAQAVLGHAPDDRRAYLILGDVHLRNRKHADALVIADKLLAVEEDGAAHYLRGKSLLALRRLHDARDAFERALALSPTMIEAMLLRREVDRAIGATRGAVGEQTAQTIDIPPALAELREVLLSGDAKRAIAALSEPRYASDPDAQLVRARFHTFDGDHYQAAHVFDHVAATWPERRFEALLGKANALLDFGYHESALAMFDQLVGEKPRDLDASEGRARAFDKLGRTGEAAAEFRRFVGLATTGSDLRVRAAQAWLDAHPL